MSLKSRILRAFGPSIWLHKASVRSAGLRRTSDNTVSLYRSRNIDPLATFVDVQTG